MTIHTYGGMEDIMTKEEAEQVLAEEEKKSGELFLKEYAELCKKHGRELQARVVWSVVQAPPPRREVIVNS